MRLVNDSKKTASYLWLYNWTSSSSQRYSFAMHLTALPKGLRYFAVWTDVKNWQIWRSRRMWRRFGKQHRLNSHCLGNIKMAYLFQTPRLSPEIASFTFTIKVETFWNNLHMLFIIMNIICSSPLTACCVFHPKRFEIMMLLFRQSTCQLHTFYTHSYLISLSYVHIATE